MDRAGSVVRPTAPPVGDRRQTIGVGREARLELVFGTRDGRTILRHAYAEPPFRPGPCFERRNGVDMILAWSAPGIFAGDRFAQQICVERGARVRLTSQSALQAHPSPAGRCAEISSTYIVEDDAQLECRWDPVIPFAFAKLSQRIDIRLAASGRLFWSDALMSGRVESRERWAFAELSHELSVRRDAVLEYLERYRIAPTERCMSRAWAVGDAGYFGTVLSSGCRVPLELVGRLHLALAEVPSVRAAADRLDSRLLLVRLMASTGAPFRGARALVDRMVAAESVLDMPEPGPHSGELSGGPA